MRLAMLEIQERYYELLNENEELKNENFRLNEELSVANMYINNLEESIKYMKEGRF